MPCSGFRFSPQHPCSPSNLLEHEHKWQTTRHWVYCLPIDHWRAVTTHAITWTAWNGTLKLQAFLVPLMKGRTSPKRHQKALCSLGCRTQSDHCFRELLQGKQQEGLKRKTEETSFLIINWKCLWSQFAISISGLGWKMSIKAMQNYLFSSPTEGQTDTMTNSESPEEKVAHFKELITISFP